ncbi:hypothetical protein [Chamaesiphon minutus]|uniref:Uncharacterized protein n=1 Tax=Chamaesiphon minutus (strain ATCC 27169 / PCC 6605) TaxID=1173020 RepID=K9UBI9_CHAP6|nr:hypothetical protein [Chamaesiphon minutus]AFY92467.1 hypothetical protein Cha6605_1263 [Chamaesiphon minutus PCC 6605]
MTDPNSISQSSFGDGSQNIAQNSGIAIAKVEQVILRFDISPQKIRTLDRFWKSWSQDTKPPFSPDLVIGGREKDRERVISWLRGNPDVLILQGEPQKEVSAFLAAVVQGLEPEERTKILSCAVVINCEISWQQLIESSDPLILIVELGEPDGIGTAIQNGHHVFVSCDRLSSDLENLLPRIVHDAAEKALQGMGLNRNKSHSYATLSRRSLSALRRKLAIAKNIQQPAWAKPNEARALLAPLLVSAWSDSWDGDRKVLEQLSEQSYDAIQTQLVRWANEPDAPVRKIGDVWTIASQEDAWILIARYLTDDDLKRFEDVAVEVLSELNPAFELPPEERMMATIYGKVLTRSNCLREGILEMLALMATRSSEILLSGANRSGEDVASRIVWRLMEQVKDHPILWASLSDKLPLIAEAAPEVLLDAIEEGLSGENPILISLFQDRSSHSALSSPHTGLLWAMERLALHPDYLSRSALSLARLTRLDPGGNLGNRPKSSLETVFIWWLYFHPNANASLSDCLQTIDTLYQREPDIAWNLSMSLISHYHMSLMERKTRWRDWVTETASTFISQDLMDASDAILEKLIANAGVNIARWCSLIDRARFMTANQKDAIVNSLEILKSQQFSFEERVSISDCLRHEISDYQKFFDSQWSMSIENIQRLNAILMQLEPDDLVYRHRELFTYVRDEDGIIENSRLEALAEILNLQGWDGVIQLAQQVRAPSFVGVALAQTQSLPIDLNLFLRENLGSPDLWRHELASSYIRCNAYDRGELWIDDCLKDNLSPWSAEGYGKFLLCLPFNLCLIDRLNAAHSETQSYFWRNVKHVEFLGVERTDWVLAKLLEFGRPHLAVDQISWVLKDNPELFSLDRIAEILESSAQTEAGQGFDRTLFPHHSAELLNYLEKTEFSRDRLANLELAYFQIHTHSRSPRILFDRLSKNPEFFVEALQCISHAENQTAANGNDEHPNRSLAQLVWHLLERWKQLPGILEDETVDEIALKSWVVNVCELAAECDRSNIADRYIGYRLSFSPSDPDGAWPHRVVRDLIELANSTVKDSWRTQIYNNRGVTSRSSTDGGEQERVLAEKYEKDAKQIGNKWPQTAAILRKLANGYNQKAAKEDVNAELTQDFW